MTKGARSVRNRVHYIASKDLTCLGLIFSIVGDGYDVCGLALCALWVGHCNFMAGTCQRVLEIRKSRRVRAEPSQWLRQKDFFQAVIDSSLGVTKVQSGGVTEEKLGCQ